MQRWPQVRAGLIALAIVLGLVEGCPLPRPGRVPAWQKGFVEPLRRAQQVVLTPVAPLANRLRLAQRWALYQAPDRNRFRLSIDGRDRDGAWHLLFRAGDPEHQEDGEMIDYDRPRGAWDAWSYIPQQYPLFADWIIARMFAKHPELVTVRVQLERITATSDGLVPSGTFIEVHARNRGRVLR